MKLFVVHSIESGGDYWSVIISGMTGFLPRKDGRLQYFRAGPYVPPLCVSGMGNLIATPGMRDLLIAVNGVAGFLEVIKARTVRLDWQTWEPGEDCWKFTRAVEPEDALLKLPHDPEVRREIGPLFEVILMPDGLIMETYKDNGEFSACFLEAPSKGLDLFAAQTRGGYSKPVISDSIIKQLPEDALRWLEFVPIYAEFGHGTERE